jgi:hypothetical protein
VLVLPVINQPEVDALVAIKIGIVVENARNLIGKSTKKSARR